jgi:hypothetical protein
MKNFDLNELLSSSMKNMAANYKTEAPTWFMPGQLSFNASESLSLFHCLESQMIQFAIFHGKTVHRFYIYLPEDKYELSNLDDVVKVINAEEKSLKLVYRGESCLLFISQDNMLFFDSNLDKIEVASFTGTKLASLKNNLKSLSKK